jgi:hypothetical protein
VVVPGFGDETNRIGLGVEQAGEPRIVRGRAPGPARHAERGEGGVQLALGREQLGVGRVGPGIAALDVVNAELVEHAGDDQLVVQCKVDTVGLRPVAQRGVEQIETFARRIACHGGHQYPKYLSARPAAITMITSLSAM